MRVQLDALHALRRFARGPALVAGRCELCAQSLVERHAHLYDPNRRQLCCTCQACAQSGGPQPSPWRRVPTRVLALRGITIPGPLWRAFGIPVELAFVRALSAQAEALASYPSAAGTVETKLEPDLWRQVQALHPALAELEPDVEALLANRLNGTESYYLVPLDECYRLVGLLRSHRFGRSAEPILQPALAGFFQELSARAEVRDA